MRALVNVPTRAGNGPSNRRSDGRAIRERSKNRAFCGVDVGKVGTTFSSPKMMAKADSNPSFGGGVDFGVQYKVDGSLAGAIASVKGVVRP